MELPDVQMSKSNIEIELNRVGITDLKMPIIISQKVGGNQNTVAKVSCFVNLDKFKKGINMSRIPIGLNKFINATLNSNVIAEVAENIRISSEAKVCELIYEFDYFIMKQSPVNKEPGLVDYHVTFTGIKSEDDYKFKFKIRTIATTCCPCSKEISVYNAHNQKCFIEIECVTNGFVWIEDVIKIAEDSASCEIFSVLKRPDEKYVTERMYENPKFVEDVARTCYDKLINSDLNIEKINIRIEADESIHMHRAIAILET